MLRDDSLALQTIGKLTAARGFMSIDNSVWVIRERAKDLCKKRIRKTVAPELGLYVDVVNHKVSIEHFATYPSIDNMRILRITCHERGRSRDEEGQEFMVAVKEEILWYLPFSGAIIVFKPTMEDKTVVTIYTVPESNG